MAIWLLPGSMEYTAFCENFTISSFWQFSRHKSTVISFVMLAGYCFSSIFLLYIISPVAASISIADCASRARDSAQEVVFSVVTAPKAEKENINV